MTMSPPFFGAQPPLHPRHSPGLALPHGAVPALAHLPTTPRGIDDWNARLRTRSEAFHLEDAAEWAHARSRSDTFSLRAPHPHPHAHPTPAHDYFALPATGPATGPASPRSPGVRVLFTPPHLSSAHPLPHAEHNPALPRFPSLDIPLLREIGTGAFATVYEGRIGSRRCAVKVVRKSLLTPKQRSDVLKEVSLLRRLDHPHIVKLLEFGEGRIAVDSAVGQDGEKEGYYYLVMELMVGGELFSRVQELTFLSEASARRIIVQVALAVHHLHRNGIVHRDIKLENLLYTPSPTHSLPVGHPGLEEDAGVGIVKLADFGLAKEVFSASTATPCGTIGYTAPEIVLSQSYSKNVDIWALGCVMYTVLCGYPPFGGEPEEVTRRVAEGGWEFGRPWWDHVGWQAKDLIANALVLDPNRRFTIEQFLSHPWILPELARLGMRPPQPIPVPRPTTGWRLPGRLDTPVEERGNWLPAVLSEDDLLIRKTPSPGTPGLDGAVGMDWSTLAALAHDRGLVAQQETFRMALPSPALPPRTPLTREAIDASYFAARAVEEHVEGAGNATRFLGRTGGSPPFLPASASMALGGIAMPSGMITPGGSVRAVNLGVVKPPGAPTPGGLLGSSFLRRPARTPGIAGPSPLAWQLPLQDPGPTSVQVPGLPLSSLGSNSLHSMTLTDGSSANSEGGSALSVHSGPGAGFELNLGESSLLARRKGNKKGAGGSGDIKLDEGMGIGGLRISGGPGK